MAKKDYIPHRDADFANNEIKAAAPKMMVTT